MRIEPANYEPLKALPQNLLAERTILATAICSPEKIRSHVGKIIEHYFLRPGHRELWRLLATQLQAGEPTEENALRCLLDRLSESAAENINTTLIEVAGT